MSSPSALTTAATPGPVRAEAIGDVQRSRSLAGWYESSWELIRGLEVIEVVLPLPDSAAGRGSGDRPLRTAG